MKTVIGIDLGSEYKRALEASLNLDFADNEFVLVHSVEVMPPTAPPYRGMTISMPKWLDHLRKAADFELAAAKAMVVERGHNSRVIRSEGFPAEILMHVADEIGADLVTVGSTRADEKGWVLGSVARALAVGSKQSVFVCKKPKAEKDTTCAVFATDESPYADACLEKFIAWAPRGLSRVDVLRVVDSNYLNHRVMEMEVGPMSPSLERSILRKVEDRTELKCQKLRAAGYESTPIVVQGSPRDSILAQMDMHRANLLIVGAQGHGFIKRVFIGSVSLYLVYSEGPSVLLMRT